MIPGQNGNTVGLFNATTGVVHARLWYTPSGEAATVLAVTDGQGVTHAAGSAKAFAALLDQSKFLHLFGQGRYLGHSYDTISTGQLHGGVTLLANGHQYDALTNGITKVIARSFWDNINDTAPKPVEYTWWDRFWEGLRFSAVNNDVYRTTQALDWVAGGLDQAGGWLIHNLGPVGYVPATITSLASGGVRLVGGIVGLGNLPGLVVGTRDAYVAYRAEGLSMFSSGFYAIPVIGGIGQVGSQLVTGRSYAAHDFGRQLTLEERITNVAIAVSIVGPSTAGGLSRAGIAPRIVSQNFAASVTLSTVLRFGRVSKANATLTAQAFAAPRIVMAGQSTLSLELAIARRYIGNVPGNKTVAANVSAQRTLSGWLDTKGFVPSKRLIEQAMTRADEFGFTFRRAGAMDRGIPGRYNASHAEIQMSFLSQNMVVSRAVCPSCRAFLSARAFSEGRTFVVMDPNRIWTFSKNLTSWSHYE